MTDRVRHAALCGLILIGTPVYLWHWPRDFYTFDEGLFLYEAKRIFEGDVMYRDFFEIVTPAWFHLMAGLYALFGVSMETARASLAAVHTLIVLCIYLATRAAGVRAPIAMLAALAHLTLAYPSCTIATPHAFTRALMILQLCLVVRARVVTRGHLLLWGILGAIVTLGGQHTGVFLALGMVCVILLDGVIRPDRRFGLSLLRPVAAYSAVLITIVGLVMLAFVAVAGFDNVFRALVEHPLVNYRRIHADIPWGAYVPTLVPLGFIIANLPLVLPLGLVILLWLWRTPSDRPQLRPLLLTWILSLASLGSVLYHPNHVHFSGCAAVWFSLTAMLIERVSQRMERRAPRARVLTGAIGAALLVGCGWQLSLNLQQRHRMFRVPVMTAFGRLDVTEQSATEIKWLTDLVRGEGVSELFAYPANAGVYLITGTRNPTRYQIVLADYTDPDQIDEVIATLHRKQVPIVIMDFYWGVGRLTELNRFVWGRYERIESPLPTTWKAFYRLRKESERDAPAVF